MKNRHANIVRIVTMQTAIRLNKLQGNHSICAF